MTAAERLAEEAYPLDGTQPAPRVFMLREAFAKGYTTAEQRAKEVGR